jgi:hypothetical protein
VGYYYQVKLESLDPGENGQWMIAWIPEEFAVKDKSIEVADYREHSRLWWPYIVREVYYRNCITKPFYPEERIRAHRKNTGDSLLKGN